MFSKNGNALLNNSTRRQTQVVKALPNINNSMRNSSAGISGHSTVFKAKAWINKEVKIEQQIEKTKEELDAEMYAILKKGGVIQWGSQPTDYLMHPKRCYRARWTQIKQNKSYY